MNDGTLALMGVSAGVGSVVGIWANHRFRLWRSKITYPQILVVIMFKGVDHITGATKEIDQNRATRRRQVIQPHGRGSIIKRIVFRTWLREWYADFRWPVPRGALGATPLPPVEVMAYYCQMGEHRNDWTFRYTPESIASRELFLDYLIRGHPTQGGGVCLALGLEYEPNMFRVEWMRATYQVRLTLRERDGSEDVPARPHQDVRSTA